MTTAIVSPQQVVDYILEKISKDFNIDHKSLVEKYSSYETIADIISNNISNNETVIKKNVVRKVTKVVANAVADTVVATVADTVVASADPPKKKLVRKVVKAVVAAEEPAVADAVTDAVADAVAIEEPLAATVADTVADTVVAAADYPKKKLVRKVSKTVVATEEPAVADVVADVVSADSPKKKVVRKVNKAVVAAEEPIVADAVADADAPVVAKAETLEEKVKPKRIVKKVPANEATPSVVEKPKKKSKKNIELVEFGSNDANSADGYDEIEANIYVDVQVYNDEDSDSLEPLELNGLKYYKDSSNYIYDVESQDLIGKLSDKGSGIIFLKDFSS